MAGRTYTSISQRPGEPADITVHLTPDEWTRVHSSSNEKRAQLSLTHLHVVVYITPDAPSAPTSEEVRFARDLADAFTAYAADVERLHATTASDAASAEPSRDTAA